jgi:hypothetical protein
MGKKRTPSDTEKVSTATTNNVAWNERISKFAAAVEKEIKEINTCLEPLVGEPTDEALIYLDDPTSTPDTDLKTALAELKIPLGKINMHLKLLRGEQKIAETSIAPEGQATQTLSLLPQVPDETSFLESLKTGGVAKVESTDVLSAVKAALANKVDLFNLPEKIQEKMEKFATAQEEPCGEEFYEMQKMLTEKRYGDVLAVLGLNARFVSEKRKNELLNRLDQKLWGALHSFHKQLEAWTDSWMKNYANPGMMFAAMAAGNTGNALPPGLMAPPDTMPIRTAGEEVINEINRIFAGTGIPVSRALAYDASRIMTIVNNPKLPMQIGATSKDQMLKDLGISVGADIVRTEQSLTRYTLSILQLPKVAADIEHAYLSSLFQLGSTIAWNKFDGKAGIGKNNL